MEITYIPHNHTLTVLYDIHTPGHVTTYACSLDFPYGKH